MGLDERTSEELRQWLRKARVYLWTFIAGGSLAFAYTYFPLHSGKERKIEHLEDRLAQEIARQTEFEEKFQAMQDRIETQSDRAAFGELQIAAHCSIDPCGQFGDGLHSTRKQCSSLEAFARALAEPAT